MKDIELLHRVYSSVDKTQKFIFKSYLNHILEISYIDKDDGKDILCVPTQSGCNQGCLFCHMTGSNIPVDNLNHFELTESIRETVNLLKLDENKPRLISYMGCGEPLCNPLNMLISMNHLNTTHTNIRFGLATILPKDSEEAFINFGKRIKEHKLNVKVHLSLHFTNDQQRHKWLPASGDILPSLDLLRWYRDYTGNKIEIHYTAIDGVNDNYDDAYRLHGLTEGIPVKLLQFNPKDGLKSEPSNGTGAFTLWLDNKAGTEIYTPPGRDIGASCGQFDLEYYKAL